jgi:TetR/AcrR family transcriptional regulator, transcriptional repressor of aconitase
VPKVSPDYLERRREQILAAARRCFARYGYAGATVARLEQETGLSRGAIFNYFPSKEELFMALAFRDAEATAAAWTGGGARGLIEHMAAQEPEWAAVYNELLARVRTDNALRQRWERRNEIYDRVVDEVRKQQERGELRDDLPADTLAHFMGLFADGLSSQVATGWAPEDLEPHIALVEAALAPRKD